MSKALIFRLLTGLSPDDLKDLLVEVEKHIFKSDFKEIQQQIHETRFSKGHLECPFCHENHIVKNGKTNGTQRYVCRQCNKTFSHQTKTPTAYSKKKPKTWMLYVECLIKGYSIRKCAEVCHINIATSFYWRHKLLDALKNVLAIGEVEGLVEADETYLPYSYKGNHSKSKSFVMPRKPHKRGKSIRARGLSNLQVAIGTVMDRNGNILIGILGTGRVAYDPLKRFFEHHITPNSILCTDSAHGYSRLAEELHLEHKKIKSGKHTNGLYHIQHINALHGNLKNFIDHFKGVSTKHLYNYLIWFKWLELFKHEKEISKIQTTFVQAQATFSESTIESIRTRKPNFI